MSNFIQTLAAIKDKLHDLDWNKIYLFDIEFIFNDLRNYQHLIESFLATEKKNLENSYNATDLEKEAEKAGEEKENYLHYLIDAYHESHYEIAKQFPHNFRSSFLVQIISTIETELKSICSRLGKSQNQIFDIEDLKGSDELEKCKIYLKKVSSIDINKFQEEWDLIKQCKKIRNQIIHHNSLINRNNQNLIDFAKATDSIELINYEEAFFQKIQFIIKNNKLIDQLLNAGEMFFVKLLQEEPFDSR